MKGFFSSLASIRRDVVGINARNLDFVYPLNPRRNFPRVDDKLLTKEILDAQGVPTPRTLAVFDRLPRLADLVGQIASLDGFAVKPAQGAGGRGILIVRRETDGRLFTPARRGKTCLPEDELRTHIGHVLAGVYSLERLFDRCFLEELLEPEEVLGSLSYKGLPDVRVLVCNGRPVMAMCRLPTRRSRGRANLHQGALGLGVDIASGVTVGAIDGNRPIPLHPESGLPLQGIHIPQWESVLDLAVRAASCVGLGYVGADVVIDRAHGPLVIELNARPGLNIQLANMRGLAGLLYGGGRRG